jgi:hypothetical protein
LRGIAEFLWVKAVRGRGSLPDATILPPGPSLTGEIRFFYPRAAAHKRYGRFVCPEDLPLAKAVPMR